jgi:hypothetical protein
MVTTFDMQKLVMGWHFHSRRLRPLWLRRAAPLNSTNQAEELVVFRGSLRSCPSLFIMVVVMQLPPHDVKISMANPDKGAVFAVPKASIKLIGVDLTSMPAWIQFAVLTCGVFVFFIFCGNVEENMFNNVKGFHFGWYYFVQIDTNLTVKRQLSGI